MEPPRLLPLPLLPVVISHLLAYLAVPLHAAANDR